jgi:uncharacterized protein
MLAAPTFLAPLLGGALIGLSATLLLASLGRIAGISGIVGNLVALGKPAQSWQLGFVLGLLAVGWVLLGDAPVTTMAPATSVIAGLLVGYGTRMGRGCTSGHGVCGVSRLSLRSLVATGTFMATAIFVVFMSRHGLSK